MKVTTSKSKNAESFYISKSFINDKGVSTSVNVLGKECDLIQSETYRNSHLAGKRNDKLLFYDCTNYYFEIEDEDGIKRYGKSKEHRPNLIIQMNKPLLNHLKKKF